MNIMSLIWRALRPQLPPPVEKHCWKIAECSLPGTAHLRRGRTCEDAVGRFICDGLLGIAVSDGAGSAPQAAVGSALAVRTALLTLFNEHLEICPITADNAAQALAGTFRQAVNTLCDRAAEMATEPRDLACTLIVVVASHNFVFAAQVGDGAVVVEDDDGNFYSLTKPTNGEFANETVLMGCAPTMDVQIRSFSDFRLKSIAVFSDGLQRLALRMPQCVPHEPFFQPLFERLQCLTAPEMEEFLQEFLGSARVNARTDDDKTLVTAQIQ
jgi:serine/threonine protein phosphatase PrpC